MLLWLAAALPFACASYALRSYFHVDRVWLDVSPSTSFGLNCGHRSLYFQIVHEALQGGMHTGFHAYSFAIQPQITDRYFAILDQLYQRKQFLGFWYCKEMLAVMRRTTRQTTWTFAAPAWALPTLAC